MVLVLSLLNLIWKNILDDQADHFDYKGNQWLSQNEKALLEKRESDIDAKIREDQRKIIVTFDLAGRRIIQEENPVSTEEDSDDELGDAFSTLELDRKPGTFQNPFLQTQKPVYRKGSVKRPDGFLTTEGIKQKSKWVEFFSVRLILKPINNLIENKGQ